MKIFIYQGDMRSRLKSLKKFIYVDIVEKIFLAQKIGRFMKKVIKMVKKSRLANYVGNNPNGKARYNHMNCLIIVKVHIHADFAPKDSKIQKTFQDMKIFINQGDMR